jgi:hypothetical protein
LSILSDFEDRLAGVVDGAFAGVFRSPVQPVEIAKALGSAMDDKRTVGVSKVYAPTHYAVSISAADAEEMGAFRDTLAGELATFVVARAQEKQYHLSSRPKVDFTVDARLKLGRFKVAAQMAAPTGPTPQPPAPAHLNEDLAARIPEVRAAKPEAPTPSSASAAAIAVGAGTPAPADTSAQAGHDDKPASGVHGMATVTVTGIDHDVALSGERIIIGRLAECDICLQDANVSREHAAFVAHDDGWAIEDLGSTNGTSLNGDSVGFVRLEDGDVIQVGVSQLIYHEPRG